MPVRFERARMRVLVLGAGYAGVALTRKLERTLDDADPNLDPTAPES